jgi:tetratricopeptide (TPR) repeat protein
MAAGHLDKAEEIFKQGLKHHPSDVMLLHNYGCLLWEGRGEYTRAEGMLQKALKIDPGHGATVQALDDLKADKMSATVRADANAAKLLAQVEVGFHPPTFAHTLSSCFGKAPTELVLSLSLAISLAVAVAVAISLSLSLSLALVSVLVVHVPLHSIVIVIVIVFVTKGGKERA